MSNQIDKLKESNTIGKFKLLVKDSLFFGGLNAFTKFFSIFLTPILTRLLTKDQYGGMDILNPIIGIAATIIICGMDSAVGRFYYKTEDEEIRKKTISSGFIVQTTLAIIICSILFIYGENILKLYLGNSYRDIQKSYLNMISLIIFFAVPIRYAQNLLIWTYKRKQYLMLSAGYITLNFIGIIAAIYLSSDKVFGVFLGQVIPAIIFSILAIYYIKDEFSFSFDKRLLIEMLKYGAPLLIVAFIPALIPSLDRYTINKFFGLTEVASYGIGFRVASLIAIPIMSINTAIGPFIMALHKEKNANRLFNVLAYATIIIVSLLIMILVVLAPFLIKVFATEEYISSLIVVVPLAFYFLTEMLKSIGAVGIDLSMKTYWNLILYPIAIIFLYAILTILTKNFGIQGAAIALMISSLTNFIMFSYVGSKLYPFKYNLLKKVFVLSIGFFFAMLILIYGSTLYYLTTVFLLFIYVFIAIYLFLSKQDRQQILTFIQNRFLKKR